LRGPELHSGAIELRAVLEWSRTRQDLDFAIGKGVCPDHGEIVAEDNGGFAGRGEGAVVLMVDDEGILHVEEGGREEWFAHIVADPAAVNCHYTVTITIMYYG
jgi:hypothetical protein